MLPEIPETDCLDEESDCSCQSEPVAECVFYDCAYGGKMNTQEHIKVYNCTKCDLTVCEICANKGAHKRHKDYFT